jgi:hypothetical protein
MPGTNLTDILQRGIVTGRRHITAVSNDAHRVCDHGVCQTQFQRVPKVKWLCPFS